MAKIIGIGETIFDILLKDNIPCKAIPGGAVFNTMISLGRLNLNPLFISEVGRDHVGDLIIDFMNNNGVNSEHMYRFYDAKTPISLAFLKADKEVAAEFYVNYPTDRLDMVWPRIDANDILVFGSYYSLNPDLRNTLVDLLNFAHDRKSIVYYDPNFRKEHAQQALWLMPSIIENLEFADVVRGSIEDFTNIYKENNVDKIYENHIRFYCPVFICSDAANGVWLRTPSVQKHYEAIEGNIVNCMGAGDALNAGIIYGFVKEGITLDQLESLDEGIWDRIIGCGLQFAHAVCQEDENYISTKFSLIK